jgi:hypothetical protein
MTKQDKIIKHLEDLEADGDIARINKGVTWKSIIEMHQLSALDKIDEEKLIEAIDSWTWDKGVAISTNHCVELGRALKQRKDEWLK